MSVDHDQIEKWRAAAERMGFEVIAPCDLGLSDGSRIQATALVKLGPPKGMVVDPLWSVLKPHADQLVLDGFGFSAITISGSDAALQEVLDDWRCG